MTTAVADKRATAGPSEYGDQIRPTEEKKEGSSFDLPITPAMIAIRAEVELTGVERYCFGVELAPTARSGRCAAWCPSPSKPNAADE